MTAAAVAAATGRVPAHVPDDPFALLPDDAVIAVAMSGGVDSSVAAALCAASGRRSFGITLAMWPRDRDRDRDRGCCSLDAVEDARRVAATLDIPHYSWNLEPEFTAEVVDVFAEEYAAGRTPNPCVRCNERIKFGVMLDRALAVGATHLATGHWARTGRRGDTATLHRGRNPAKDQAYTLHRLNQDQLRRAVFPLGPVASKAEVRAIAARRGLVTATRPDSQELCFVDVSVRRDLEGRLAGRFAPGPILDASGMVVGEHRGVPFYTVGQRTGLGIAVSRPDARPLHVIAVDAAANTVTVGGSDMLRRDQVRLSACTWVSAPPRGGDVLTVQLRSHAPPAPVVVADEAADAGCLTLACNPPVSQVAPGQAAVVYDRDEVIGGGVVSG